MADTFLNIGHYSEVDDKYRVFYAYVSALRARYAYLKKDYFYALQMCDDGLLKGMDLENSWLSNYAKLLCSKALPSVKPIIVSIKLLKNVTIFFKLIIKYVYKIF